MPANTGDPATDAAGVSPTPMTVDEGFFYQPAQANFQFVQSNLTYIHEGNIDAFRREAEERHTQIMEQKVQQLRQEFGQVCLSELAQQRAEANRHEQMASELTGFAMSRAVAEQEVMKLRKELSEANAKPKNAANAVALEAEQRANQKVSHLTSQYKSRYSELKGNLEADCKKIVDETVEYARQGMEGYKHEEQAVIKEMREECNRQEEQAAELNFQPQERVNELMEKLNKYKAPDFKIEELEDGPGDIQLEMFATPKSASAKAGATPMPNAAMNDLAAVAREKLHSLFSSTPAGSTAPPKLPTLPVQKPPSDNANQEPSVRSPTVAASEPEKLKNTDVGAGLSGQQPLDLITRLTSKDSDGEKPRAKEAETTRRKFRSQTSDNMDR